MNDFTYKIYLDVENHLIHLVVEGELAKQDGEKVIKETRERAEENQLPILCDITKATIKASLADWFFLVRNREIYPRRPEQKTAILVDPDSSEIYRFFENVSRNVGFKIRIFFREADARDWLKSVD